MNTPHVLLKDGSRFGLLTIVEYMGTRRDGGGSIRHMYAAICDCGTPRVVIGSALTSGKTKSCGCYNRARLLESIQSRMMHAAQKIHTMSIPEPNTGCWLWTRGLKSGGYGTVRYMGEVWTASRLSYVTFRGPIPNGMCVLHRCDTPPCVNPDHLFLGTQQDNVDDKVAKGRHPVRRGEKHHNASFTDDQVRELRALGLSAAASMSEQLGVARAAVVRAVSGRTWAHLDVAPRPARKLQRVAQETIDAIRSEWDGRRGTQSRLARKFNLSFSHVHRIVHGESRV